MWTHRWGQVSARGRMEGFIKNHKTYLHSDRTSCNRFEANQFRLFLHSAAYLLLHALKDIGLAHGFTKKTQKTPKREIDTAERRRRDYFA